MTVAWPDFLPKPQRQAHAYSQADLLARSSMEGGPPRVRQKYSDGPRQFAIGLTLKSKQQWALFEAFYKFDLRNGAAEFYLPVDSGTGVVNRRAIFSAQPSYDTSPGNSVCLVSAQVQIIEDTTMTQEQYDVLKVTPDFLSAEDLLDYIINTLYPGVML